MQFILVGFMGVGKTTVGRLLAQTLGVPVVDLDQQFITQIGQTPGEYMAQYSEAKFRQLEQQILKEQLATATGVISSGGGILTLPSSRELLINSNAQVIYLKSDFTVNLGRLQGDRNQRPLMTRMSAEELHVLWQTRQSHYQQVATVTIDTNQQTPAQIVAQIIQHLKPEDQHNA